MPERRALGLVVVLAGVQMLAVLDSLAAALALPAIAADLDLGTAGRAWVLNATSVALAGGLLVAGRLGDVLGRKRVFLAGLVVLVGGSALCAAAPSIAVLLIGRALLGLGAAVTYPSALSLTSSSFPDEPWRGRAFTAGAMAGALGSLGGAVYGGVVTGALGWRWVFGLTLPLTAALYLWGRRLLDADDVPRARRRTLDLSGAGLATAVVTMAVAAAIGAGTASMPGRLAVALAVGVLAMGLVLIHHERRQADPLLPATVLRAPRLLGGCSGNAANSALWSVVVFVLAQQLQAAGWSPIRTGLATLPASVGIVVSGLLVVPPLRRRLGSPRTAVAGLLLGAACVAALARSADTHSTLDLLAPLLLLGVGLNAAHTGLYEHTLKWGDEHDQTVSAAVFESSAHVGGALSISLFAGLLTTGHSWPAYLAAAATGVVGALAVGRWSGSVSERPSLEPVDLR